MSTRRAAKLMRRERRKDKKRKALRPLIETTTILDAVGVITKTKEQALETGGVFVDQDGTISVVEVLK